MVNPTVNQVADEFTALARDREYASYGILAGSLAGGAFVAQRVTREVLPFFGISPTSGSASGLVAQVLSKLVVAFGLGYAALQLDGAGNSAVYAVTGAAAAGAITMAGASLFRLGETAILDNPAIKQATGGHSASSNVGRVVESGSPSPGSSGSATASASPF